MKQSLIPSAFRLICSSASRHAVNGLHLPSVVECLGDYDLLCIYEYLRILVVCRPSSRSLAPLDMQTSSFVNIVGSIHRVMCYLTRNGPAIPTVSNIKYRVIKNATKQTA